MTRPRGHPGQPAPARSGWRQALLALAVCAAALWGGGAQAAFPQAYSPMVVQPTGEPDRAEFDLRPALQRAQREHKRLYVYLGAHDCRYCQRYEAFLQANAARLVPEFARQYIVVDLRSALANNGARLHLRTGAQALPYADFQRSIGDERARLLVYPSVWLLGEDGKPLMQMPAGAGTFETVDEQLEILRLEQ